MVSSNISNASEYVLETKGIHKKFPGVHALKDFSFNLKRGEILALIGENGAGKSTLMKILTGIIKADDGEVFLGGKKVMFVSPKEAQENGLSIVHQELNLMNHLSVAQNIFIGKESKGFWLNDKSINEKTTDLLKTLNLNLKPDTIVETLTVGKQQMVEIAKALSYDSTILILDEPTAALTESETQELFAVMDDLKKKGVSMVYISHRMDEIKKVTDRITVMRDGEYVTTMDTKTATMDQIVHAMVGRTILSPTKSVRGVRSDAKNILEVKNLKSKAVKDVSFELRHGEILGLAGLMGAGRTEVARLIFGADKKREGTIILKGKEVSINEPIDAVQLGIGYLSEDRKRYGLATGLSVSDNEVMANLDSYKKGIFVNENMIKEVSQEYVDKVGIKTSSIKTLVKTLSGGNQQKVIVAKWLIRQCDILIFDEPTRGIDVGAKSEIYSLMNDLVAEGKSIIMISSELEEVLRMSDRIICMSEGRITGILDIEEASQEAIMHLATSR